MRSGPIAELPARANEQHYELPAAVLRAAARPAAEVFGRAVAARACTTRRAAEEAMLELTCERAQIADGMRVLDLGCGWGSLSLWLAERYPGGRVVAVSNSRGAARVDRGGSARARGLAQPRGASPPTSTRSRSSALRPRRVDRDVRAHAQLASSCCARIAGWLEPDGGGCSSTSSPTAAAYEFEGTWAAERFFTAGRMPSHDLLLRFQRDLRVSESGRPGTTTRARWTPGWRASTRIRPSAWKTWRTDAASARLGVCSWAPGACF